jgi:excisionase family DNA binding protein
MTTLSLREAAEQAGVSKSTVFRAITSGRMSAPRDDLGNFTIDPAELFRVYPPKSTETKDGSSAGDVPARSGTRDTGRDAPAQSADHELALRLATAEAQLAGVKDLLEAERKRGEELRRQAERWEMQAERLSLTLAAPKPEPVIVAPAPASFPQSEGTTSAPPRGEIRFVPPSWWPWKRSA